MSGINIGPDGLKPLHSAMGIPLSVSECRTFESKACLAFFPAPGDSSVAKIISRLPGSTLINLSLAPREIGRNVEDESFPSFVKGTVLMQFFRSFKKIRVRHN